MLTDSVTLASANWAQLLGNHFLDAHAAGEARGVQHRLIDRHLLGHEWPD